MRPNGSTCLGITLASLICMGVASSARAEIGVTDKEILIGSCSTLQQDIGMVEQLGATAYIQYVNEELGGVHGRKLRVLFGDDQFTADGAAKCYARMLKEGVFSLAFVATGAEAVQYVKLATTDKLPIITMANGAPFMYEPVKRYIFSMRSTYTQEAYQIAEGFQRRLGARRLAAIYMSDGLGFAGLDGFRQSLAAHKRTPAAEISFLRTAEDMTRAVQTARAAKPDAVIIIGNYR